MRSRRRAVTKSSRCALSARSGAMQSTGSGTESARASNTSGTVPLAMAALHSSTTARCGTSCPLFCISSSQADAAPVLPDLRKPLMTRAWLRAVLSQHCLFKRTSIFSSSPSEAKAPSKISCERVSRGNLSSRSVASAKSWARYGCPAWLMASRRECTTVGRARIAECFCMCWTSSSTRLWGAASASACATTRSESTGTRPVSRSCCHALSTSNG
mmetsp:Transcript_256/g.593  ORF Transcript_256/g.593 Transcript_256/m.593 type:complete len:215 (+) Transcript_256:2610-3254(+)